MEQDVSTISNFSLFLTACLGLLMLLLPRRYVLAPLLISGCYMTLGQSVVLGGLHFTIFRILILIGLLRIVLKKEMFRIEVNAIDKAMFAWITVSFVTYVILNGVKGAVDDHAGFIYGILGTYLIIRVMLRSIEDVIDTVKIFSVIIIPLSLFFLFEMKTGKNLFSIFGGVPELSEIRNGRIRCQGPFRHAILAGTFGATSFPLLIGLWFYKKRSGFLTGSAMLAAAIIVLTSVSSGSMLAFVAGIIGLLCWPIRSRMRVIRWAIVILLLTLHAVMNAPVWFIIARVSDFVGGGGYHRAALIDTTITHFREWWLVGTTYTAHWMPFTIPANPNMIDITNQFICEGVNGGVLTMVLFILVIVKCFKGVGVAVIKINKASDGGNILIWSLGCAVLGHVVSMFSVAYFDQIIIFWYLIVAMIAGLISAMNTRGTGDLRRVPKRGSKARSKTAMAIVS